MAPIPGTTKRHRLDEDIRAVALELTPDDLREIESATSKTKMEDRAIRKSWSQLPGVERTRDLQCGNTVAPVSSM